MHDVVIVGAGTAGCVLAARLTEDPGTRVLLLEAGGRDRDPRIRIPAAFSQLFKTPIDWNYATTPQRRLDGRELYWPRGRVLGGSSTINAMMWVRGNPADYDAWAEQGCDGWSYDELLPWFTRSEHTLRHGGAEVGRGGPLVIAEQRDPNPATHAFVAACLARGIPRNDRPNERGNDGVSLTQVTQRRGARQSLASAYLRPAMKRDNLEVVTGAHVHRVVIDHGRAVAVDYDVHGVQHTATAVREVVVAAGAVNTPQVLMLSGVGPADHLAEHGIEVVADLPVGHNLSDHLASAVVWHTDRDDTLLSAERPGAMAAWLLRRRGPLTSNVAEAHAFLRVDEQAAAPDIELIFAPFPFLDHGLGEPEGPGLTVGTVLLSPESRGRVTLAGADPHRAPVIEPDYLAAEADVTRLVAGLQHAQRLMRTLPLADFVTGPMVPDRVLEDPRDWREHLREYTETLYHPVGTAKMGVDDDAVVTPDLRVRGVDALRVADASVMPTLNTGHTNAPVVMIAEKAADLVRSPAAVA